MIRIAIGVLAILVATQASAPAMDLSRAPGTIRVAVFNTGLYRSGAGMLLRDVLDQEKQVLTVARILRRVQPDIVLLTSFDRDPEGRALAGFAKLLAGDALAEAPLDLPYRHQARVNTGHPSGFDLDRDDRLAEPEDAWGYGAFPGQYAMVLLSRYPLDHTAIRSYRRFRWAEMPDARRPHWPDGTAFHSDEVWQALRLSSKSHWDVPVILPGERRLRVLAAHPTPPVFDGPADRNGRRNADELRLLAAMLDGADWLIDDAGVPATPVMSPAVILGTLNADPRRGAADQAAIAALLTHPRLQDPKPTSPGDPSGATAAWARDDGEAQRQRVDYVLPTVELAVIGSGVFWPGDPDPDAALLSPKGAKTPTPNRLVWVDLRLP